MFVQTPFTMIRTFILFFIVFTVCGNAIAQTQIIGDYWKKKNNSEQIDLRYFTIDSNIFFKYRNPFGWCDQLNTTINQTETDSVFYKSQTIAIQPLGTSNGVGFMLVSGSLWATKGTSSSTHRILSFQSSSLSPFFEMHGKTYFFAREGSKPHQLFVTDGTTYGTRLLGEYDYDHKVTPYVFKGHLYWKGGRIGTLHVSDGTSAGTYSNSKFKAPHHFIGKGSTVFFFHNGDVLVRSDGTIPGTQEIKDLNPGIWPNFPSSSFPSQAVIFKNQLYFFAEDSAAGRELWQSDGTVLGTAVIKDLVPGKPGIRYYPTTFGEFKQNSKHLFFAANDGSTGVELYRTDGTPSGTKRVADSKPGSGDGASPLTDAIIYKDKLFYNGKTNASGSYQLFISEGDSSNTIHVNTPMDSPSDFIIFNGKLLFKGSQASPRPGKYLYTISGSNASPVRLRNRSGKIFMAAGRSASFIDYWAKADHILFFSAIDPDNLLASELFRTDGTSAGTWMLQERNSSTDSGNLINPPQYGVDVFKGAWLAAIQTEQYGLEMWKIKGPKAAQIVRDIEPGSGAGFVPKYIHAPVKILRHGAILNNEYYFRGRTKHKGVELWKTGGDSASTALVHDLVFGTVSSNPSLHPVPINGILIGSAFTYPTGDELFRTDGTASGSYILKDINPGVQPSNNQPRFSSVLPLDTLNNQLIFQADSNPIGNELWITDGTVRGTRLLKDINPGPNSGTTKRVSGTVYSSKCNNNIFFTATDGILGYELWKTDGTTAGTQMVKDINQGNGDGSSGGNMVCLNDTLYFVGNNGTSGWELWKSAGSAASTILVADINPGADESFIRELTLADSAIFFSAYGGTRARNNAYQIWKSNGKSNGTSQVSYLEQHVNTRPKFLTPLKNKLIFSGFSSQYGWEPYISHGDTSYCGTHMLDDIRFLEKSSNPYSYTPKGDSLLFYATDNVNGLELHFYKLDNSRKLLFDTPEDFYSCDTNDKPLFEINICSQVDSMRWFTSSGGTWVRLFNGTSYSGTNSELLQLNSAMAASDGSQFRLVAYAKGYHPDTSKIAKLYRNSIRVLSLSKKPTLCSGKPTGYGKVFASSQKKLHYTWSSSIVHSRDTNEIFTLLAGKNKVRIFDEYNCKVDTSITILDTVEITIKTVTPTSPNCIGGNDGKLSFSFKGGIRPYSYKWINHSSTDSIALNLPKGYHEIEVTDDVGCNKKFGHQINDGKTIFSNKSIDACHKDTITFLGKDYWKGGLYTDTLTSVLGCDSLISLQLSFTNFSDSVYLIDDTLFAQYSNAGTYRWIDCTTNKQVPGAFNSYFVGKPNTPYQVVLRKNTCTDTTVCVTTPKKVISQPTGLENRDVGDRITFFPNPADAVLYLNSASESKLRIRTLTGVNLLQGVISEGINSVDLTKVPSGIYFLLFGEGAESTYKLIITH